MKQPHPLLHSIQILPCPEAMLHKTCSGDRGKWPRLAGLQGHEDSAREGSPLLSPHRSLRLHPSERVTERECVLFRSVQLPKMSLCSSQREYLESFGIKCLEKVWTGSSWSRLVGRRA